jgi:folylpolyglutamate synthase
MQLKTQQELATTWSSLIPSFPPRHIHVLPSIEHAVTTVKSQLADGVQVDVLVTGSLHLVGGVIDVAGLADVAI